MELASPFALFRDDRKEQSLLFRRPREVITARTGADVVPALKRLEAARREGAWLAGFISYETGYAFEEKLQGLIPANRATPLISMGIFDRPDRDVQPVHDAQAQLSDFRVAWDFETYRDRFDRLHHHICRGDCYQANLTMPVAARWQGDPQGLFWSLIDRQPVRYGALVDFGAPIILSRSPELFFSVDAERFIETHPMKGTAPRGKDTAEDRAIVAAMLADEKTLAENRMIVDLLRNDISVISEVGSLLVPKLFEVETYPTVHQLVSHVRARLLAEVGFPEIVAALFPCGSVTGAPKMWAMRILAELEQDCRDVYCGAIGWCDPAGPMRFSVAIRTISLFNNGEAVFNVGGGIVFDSTAEAEYEECLLKARFAAGSSKISP